MNKKRKILTLEDQRIKIRFIEKIKKITLFALIGSFVAGIIILIYFKDIIIALIGMFVLFGFILLYSYARIKLNEVLRIKKMEMAFPDFLQLMSSNLRAGMTTDRALLLSARKEFDPLDKEIIKLGKDLVTGRKIEESLENMSSRIKSEKIEKMISLLVSGIKSGGNMAVLLEQASVNMREREFVEKRSASNVLMYVIFIFFASAVGAPALFSLSSVLVEILSNILSSIPAVETTSSRLPFTLTQVSVSPKFVLWFSFFFMLVTNIIGSFVIGLVQKGEEREGLKFILPLISISIVVFFVMRLILRNYFSGIVG